MMHPTAETLLSRYKGGGGHGGMEPASPSSGRIRELEAQLLQCRGRETTHAAETAQLRATIRELQAAVDNHTTDKALCGSMFEP